MTTETYRQMHLLNEVTQTPDATQRDLAKRLGVALGLTNLMLRRLAKKGYIKVVNVKPSRLRYLITPKGVTEKVRLTREYVEYSLFFYRHVRSMLRQRLWQALDEGRRRILVWGTGELAEVALLTIQEVRGELAGVVEHLPERDWFLSHAVQPLEALATVPYDCVVVASLPWYAEATAYLARLGVSSDRVIVLPKLGEPLPAASSATLPSSDGLPEIPRQPAAAEAAER